MVERRNMLGTGLLAGLTGLFVSPAAEAAAGGAGEDTSEAAARAIDRLRTDLGVFTNPTDLGRSASIEAIRQQQRTFLVANRKYPDFIEVGMSVWEDIYDWHVKQRQPINVARLADGRYVIAFMFTSLILRPDQDARYVGYAFDNEPARPARNP